VVTPGLTDKLSRLSRDNFAPLPQISDWPDELTAERLCFSLELSSFAGTGRLQGLTETRQKRLAFFELINFFSLNIHGERLLVAGLAEQLYGPCFEPSWGYLHHFLDEENKHLHYFATFCRRYAGKIYEDRKLAFQPEVEREPAERALCFFAKVLIFEEVVDYFNRRLAMDTAVLAIVRRINQLHHRDEVRHLAFGRLVTRQLCERYAPAWPSQTLARIRDELSTYLDVVMREYVNPEVYLDAGIVDAGPGALGAAHALAREAYDAALPLRLAATARVRGYLGRLTLI
jgi:hypothetical protein